MKQFLNSNNLPIVTDLKSFLNQSPTPWHACKEIKKRLEAAGFESLQESETWELELGKNYFVEKHGATLCAFSLPSLPPARMRIFSSHLDSPGFKLKPCPELRKQGMILLKTETYGSPLLNSWLNRDLGLAGKIIYKNHSNQIVEESVFIDEHPFTIPQLAIHLDREISEKGLLLNKQDHLNALAALSCPEINDLSYLELLIREKVDFQELIDFDLFLIPLEKARFLGYHQQFLASYRIDSLASVHAILTAFLEPKAVHPHDISMIVFWDHEEIGSKTHLGAGSPFFTQIVQKIQIALHLNLEDAIHLLNRSHCVSVDLAHGAHPNHLEKHDAEHSPTLGKGVVLKYNAGQRYATNSLSALPIHTLAKIRDIPLQKFVNRNDIPAGSTIGPILAEQTGILTVDIGISQLSMHSCREVISCQDHIWLVQLLEGLMQVEKWPVIDSMSIL